MPVATSKARIIPLRGVTEIPESGGRHSGPEYHETFEYAVEFAGEIARRFATKPQAEAYVLGREDQRNHSRTVMEAAL